MFCIIFNTTAKDIRTFLTVHKTKGYNWLDHNFLYFLRFVSHNVKKNNVKATPKYKLYQFQFSNFDEAFP